MACNRSEIQFNVHTTTNVACVYRSFPSGQCMSLYERRTDPLPTTIPHEPGLYSVISKSLHESAACNKAGTAFLWMILLSAPVKLHSRVRAFAWPWDFNDCLNICCFISNRRHSSHTDLSCLWMRFSMARKVAEFLCKVQQSKTFLEDIFYFNNSWKDSWSHLKMEKQMMKLKLVFLKFVWYKLGIWVWTKLSNGKTYKTNDCINIQHNQYIKKIKNTT